MVNIIISAVGGQGAVLLSNILGVAAAKNGVNVKTAELHGLSQRSGSIVTHLRMGEVVESPLIPSGEADIIVAMELQEALRYIDLLKPGGLVIASNRIIHHPAETIQVSRKEQTYVHAEDVKEKLNLLAKDVKLIETVSLAEEAGNLRTENVVLLGALTATGLLPLSEDELREAIKKYVPQKAVDVNLKAFNLGLAAGK